MGQLTEQNRSWAQRRRRLIDRFTARLVAVGGLGVIAAIGAIFFYLLWVVAPAFQPARMDAAPTLPAPAPEAGRTLGLGVEDAGEIGYRFTVDGRIVFFDLVTGTVRAVRTVPGAAGERVLRLHAADPDSRLYALELPGGRFAFVELRFPVSFASGERQRRVVVDTPFGEDPLAALAAPGVAVVDAAVRRRGNELTLAALTADDRLVVTHFDDAEPGWQPAPPARVARAVTSGAQHLFLGRDQWLFLLGDDGVAAAWNLRFEQDPWLAVRQDLTPGTTRLRTAALLAGGTSLLVATADGRIRQWFPARDDAGEWSFVSPRSFASRPAVERLLPETRRRGFAVLTESGVVSLYHTTAEEHLLDRRTGLDEWRTATLSPRADRLLVETADERIHQWRIDNEHPEISLSSLWDRVWYEGYPEPAYVWQSSSAAGGFEPKFSLTPLAFGTLKASLYAMLFAVPLAIMGAVYTGYFMAPRMRDWVKPSIEIMEALPTVILGFLAGLWLAPLVEKHLTAVLGLLLVLPFGLVAFGFGWRLLPSELRARVPEGWHAVILVPVILAVVAAAFWAGPYLEAVLFEGDLRTWLREVAGIDYQQRNALVVGMAMGVAVIPTIFSITEDAIYSVPRHLVDGSLALGATPWQTLVRVVLLTASPGIFSAVVIGLGRAVGETMIVLMATGNTPVMDLDMFSGMRTFSANLAIELPEAEVRSSHYRILFLAALVLFVLTFVLNTVAELVRQRLRSHYGSL